MVAVDLAAVFWLTQGKHSTEMVIVCIQLNYILVCSFLTLNVPLKKSERNCFERCASFGSFYFRYWWHLSLVQQGKFLMLWMLNKLRGRKFRIANRIEGESQLSSVRLRWWAFIVIWMKNETTQTEKRGEILCFIFKLALSNQFFLRMKTKKFCIFEFGFISQLRQIVCTENEKCSIDWRNDVVKSSALLEWSSLSGWQIQDQSTLRHQLKMNKCAFGLFASCVCATDVYTYDLVVETSIFDLFDCSWYCFDYISTVSIHNFNRLILKCRTTLNCILVINTSQY